MTNFADQNVSQLRPQAQALKLKGAWNATKAQLVEMLTQAQANHQAHTEALIQPEVTQVAQVEEVQPEVTEVTQVAKATKTSKTKVAKVDKSVNELQKVTAEQLARIDDFAKPFMGPNEQDYGKLVVKRQVITSMLEDALGIHVPEKVFNQVVVLASRGLPRMPFTVTSTGSRYGYLLAEVSKEGQVYSPAVLVLEYTLLHPELINQAKANYQQAAKEGSDAIQQWMNSKAN